MPGRAPPIKFHARIVTSFERAARRAKGGMGGGRAGIGGHRGTGGRGGHFWEGWHVREGWEGWGRDRVIAPEIEHHGVMPTLTDLARSYSSLSGPDLEWLHSLVSDWQLLADLSFADLILWVPVRSPSGAGDSGWVAVAQMRPTTGPTSFPDDVVGTRTVPGERALLDTAQSRAPDLAGERPRLGHRRPGPGRGHPRDQERAGHRGHRAVDQPQLSPHAEPPGAHLLAGRR